MSDTEFDWKAFSEFERTGWDKTASLYDRHFENLTPHFGKFLLDAVELAEGENLLDVATGPGYVAGNAVKHGAVAMGVDFAENMVAEAQRRFPDAQFQPGDAEALPFPDSTFDVVVSNFGLLHVSRPEVALTEMRRVLKPGGRIAFSVWGNPQSGAIGFGILLKAVSKHGTMEVGLPPGPPMFRFSDHDECLRVLGTAGFEEAEVRDIEYYWPLSEEKALFRAFSEAGVRAGAILRAQTPEQLTAIIDFVHAEAAIYSDGTQIKMPMHAVLSAARKPKAQ